MNGARRAVGVAAVLLALILVGQVLAADWAQWRGPARDGKAAGFKAPDTWPEKLSQKWKVAVGAGDASPVLVGDKVVVFARQGGDEVTLCLNTADGKEVWRDKNAVPAISGPSARQHAGPRSTPAVGDGHVVTLGVTGVLTCLNAADGKLAWRKDDIKGAPRFYTASSPLITDGMVIAQLGSEDGGMIAAFALADGKEKWKCADHGPAYASPVLMTVGDVKQVVAMTSKAVVGVGLTDGKVLWQIPFVPQGRSYNAATPVVDGDIVYVTGAGRGTTALKIAKGDDGFAAKEVWSNPLAAQYCSPVVKDGMLYCISDKGDLFCLDAADGKTVWTNAAKLGAYGAMLDVGGAILALPDKGELLVFKGGKEYVELARYKVADGATFACPAATEAGIFVKGPEELVLCTLP